MHAHAHVHVYCVVWCTLVIARANVTRYVVVVMPTFGMVVVMPTFGTVVVATDAANYEGGHSDRALQLAFK